MKKKKIKLNAKMESFKNILFNYKLIIISFGFFFFLYLSIQVLFKFKLFYSSTILLFFNNSLLKGQGSTPFQTHS
jgi:hypothetical protein